MYIFYIFDKEIEFWEVKWMLKVLELEYKGVCIRNLMLKGLFFIKYF